MTARQQLARLLPLALLVVLVFAGLRGAVPAPRWNGPLRAGGVAIGLALEGVLGVLLVITLRRDAAAARAARGRPYAEADDEPDVAAVLRFVLRWVLGAGMVAIAAVLIANLHLHFFTVPKQPRLRPVPAPRTPPGGAGTGFNIPVGLILFGLLVLALVAAVVISAGGRRGCAARRHRDGSRATSTPRTCGRRLSRAGPRWPGSTTRGPRSSPATWRWSAASPTGARRAASRTPPTSCCPGPWRRGSCAASRRGG
jgi:hypothetical protein